MKATSTTIFRQLLQARPRLHSRGLPRDYINEEPPLRSELFSAEQMEQYGKTLAALHQVSPARGRDQLLKRLASNENVLIRVRNLLTEPVRTNRRITPAGEWLLDNFYLIEEQIHTAKRDLPRGYSRELPRLLNGASAGLPRVYDLAFQTIAHSDGRVDPEILRRFVAAYQTVTTLRLGELWAIPIMLRLALIENLRRVGLGIGTASMERNLADSWADQMTEIAENDPKSLILVVADMARSHPPMVSPFVAELARRLQGQTPALALALTWIEQQLSESGLTIEQMVQSEGQQQAADQVSISNSIASLRALGATDWRDFVEAMSVVEQTLRQDMDGVYGRMDFATRDRYRHVVEEIAKRSPFSEGEVARKALQLAHAYRSAPGDDHRARHVGFYLIDKGLSQLEQTAAMRITVLHSVRRPSYRSAFLWYLGTITLITVTLSGILFATSAVTGWMLAIIGFLSLLATSQLAVAVVNWLATLLVTPHPLPRMDFSEGIPPESRALAVVPAMIMSAENVEELTEALEIRFLANRDDNLHFGLLTDFADAHEETTAQDEPLLQLAQQRIEELNRKYKSGREDIFFLFHRPRRWNPRERIWMGYERKRGKLGDLNSLLRGGALDRFSLIVGEPAVLPGVRYVITLDTDTQLPRDSARQFVAAMAHPLNRPSYGEDQQRIVEGYGILQPRVAVSLPGANRSRYARLFGSEPGIDPYTRAVSDVYQDLFHEGSFIGKGIYDVDAFERALAGRFPENRILSHDLLEGCYARSGLLSDVQLYEHYPSRYTEDVGRRHRWIRGDWQLAPWLLRRAPAAGGRRSKYPISGLSRWKIFDNLRRSLVPSALILLSLLGWTVLASAWFWTVAVIGIILIPPLLVSLLDALRLPSDVLLRQHFAGAARSASQHFAQAAFTLACLPYEALFSLDAILRTIWRMLFSRRRLLEWSPSSELDRNSYPDLVAFCRSMWIGPVLAFATVNYLAIGRPAALVAAGPILGLWLVCPAIAWWVSRPLIQRGARLTTEQIIFLRTVARKTWAFFEKFVGPEDHWLPPDNHQEHPVPEIAHRTSPTNMGLALLANLAAYDLGYISGGQFIERTANALHAMEGLERHRGHFYNWYDTQSLKPLAPRYVSTVDSGNLAAHLLTLRRGLLALPDDKILNARVFEGLADTLRVLLDAAGGASLPQLAGLRQDLETGGHPPPTTLTAARLWLDRLARGAAELVRQFPAAPDNQVRWWASALARQCEDALRELTFLAPWLSLPVASEPFSESLRPDRIPTLRELAELTAEFLPGVEQRLQAGATSAESERLARLRPLITEANRRSLERLAVIDRLALQLGEFTRVEHEFLFDEARHLLAIGYNVDAHRRDASYYDLLASEARLGSFVAIAQGYLPQECWFALGRLLTTTGGDPTLLSWSGSMFEYLMPLLVMPTYENTLLDTSCKAAVNRQIEYGSKHGVPWGISESGYNAVDVHLNYQYRAFGVPGLGLRRGLAEDLVIAPYASALALLVAPQEACTNLQRLAAEGFEGSYGFYEAIDYTPSRLRRGQSHAVVRSFMAHHQGMSLLSLVHPILDRPMQKRFESDPLFQSTTLLLQERIPKTRAFHLHLTDTTEVRASASAAETPVRAFGSPHSRFPEVQLLSNGRYHVMITNAGGGYSRWKDIAVTRWREDPTCDNWGTFCYIRDVASGEFWSTSHQPALKPAETYEAIFSEARAEFRRHDGGLDTHTEIAVSPEDDVEIRRTRITNRSRTRKTIDVTSYAEVVLASPAADALHPAFSNLFVQTEIIAPRRAILCTRRPCSLDEHTPWMFHLMAVHGTGIGEVSYETDRMRFIGRGNTVANPRAMRDSAPLSGTQGPVLDPIVAIRRQLTLEPDESATMDMVTGLGESRDSCLSLVEKYQDQRLADRGFDLAWTHSRVVRRQLNASESDAQLYSRLASAVIYASSSLRADRNVLIQNRRGQSGLWGYAISGDLPIVLLQIGDPANIDLARQLVQAHAYWRLKGLAVDLVIWNEDYAGYRQQLHDQIMGLIAAGVEAHVVDRPGGVFVRAAEQISSEDRVLLQSVARAIFTDRKGTLVEQINRRESPDVPVPRFQPTRSHLAGPPPVVAESFRRDLLFANGLGGFTRDGREYVTTLVPGQMTPAPWVNVLANTYFGSVISETGPGYTWSENAHEFRLTPWSGDPVSDSSGEAYFIRDEESGYFWSPTLLPARGASAYVIRHGFGYSIFEHTENGIRSELCIYAALDAPVKFAVMKVRNESGRSRRLSATGYVEWVMGDLRSKTMMHVSTELDPTNGALYARNPYNIEFPDRIAFFHTDAPGRTVTGDRSEFIGRNGVLRDPAAMRCSRLSGKTGAAMDPCGAIQVPLELAVGQEREIVFTLGVGRDSEDARKLAQCFTESAAARVALEAIWQYWNRTLGAVHVETPDRSVNVLINGWLLYQTLACRLWARSGYYQSAGAFGFRDQLQDVMALVHAEPKLVREHLLRCAARQFAQGDVQHWWHPPSGRGVRTHCSDDYLWLPLVTCRYVLSTGDTGVLDETVPFIDGRPVNPEEDSYYDLPSRCEETGSLYEHCVRAILKGLQFGEHGLPLIGSGDWNDGMNRVGIKGKGESIWLGFFLHEVLTRFADVAGRRGDLAFVERCESEATRLRRNIEQHGWDGEWYRRAYFDDGSALGSASNAECQIDSIAQSWSVLSGAGAVQRSRMAMDAVYERLVRRDHALIQLLDPPFDKSNLDPGYIRGYVPGVRENGGQYTHGAIWAAMAFAALGERQRAWELMAMINPVNHAKSPAGIDTYKVEPYVVAADIYALTPHAGRGGWTWYTGSAGWMYRLILESLLGLRLDVDMLYIAPCLPADWKSYKIHYRYRETTYHITVLQTPGGTGETSVTVDGTKTHDRVIRLVDDRREHFVDVRTNAGENEILNLSEVQRRDFGAG